MSDEDVAALQSVVLRAVESAPGCIDGHVLRLNPHLWRKEDMRSVYSDRDIQACTASVGVGVVCCQDVHKASSWVV